MLNRLKEDLSEALKVAIREAAAAEGWPPTEVPEVPWEYPTESSFGDLSTPVAFSLAKQARKRPKEIAGAILKRLVLDPLVVEQIEVAGAGYLNIFIPKSWWQQVIREVLRAGALYGRAQVGEGKKVQVEFVSANPTGPLHVGHGRGAALGDALANLLQAVGFQVEREYYVNDAGTQMEILGRSILARYQQLLGRDVPFPEGGYQGGYITGLAREIIEREGDRFLNQDEGRTVLTFSAFATRAILKGIRTDLDAFGVQFDRWFDESALYRRHPERTQTLLEEATAFLKEKGFIYEEEGALWFRSTAFGDDKDRVLIRSSGEPTYYASDVAYHMEKFRRGYDLVIDIWGHDHHGYVQRVKAAVQALGYPPEALQILLIQLVNLLRGGRPVAMSTRAGEFVTLKEVLDEVGKDAARFIFLTRRAEAPLDFDLEVAKVQSEENPVYYVQYAYARLSSVLREAERAGFPAPYLDADLTLLQLPEEFSLMKQLALYPEMILGAAAAFEPHRLTAYLQEVAGQLHSYYRNHRFISADAGLSRARLALAEAVRSVIGDALRILGVAAPERM